MIKIQEQETETKRKTYLSLQHNPGVHPISPLSGLLPDDAILVCELEEAPWPVLLKLMTDSCCDEYFLDPHDQFNADESRRSYLGSEIQNAPGTWDSGTLSADQRAVWHRRDVHRQERQRDSMHRR